MRLNEQEYYQYLNIHVGILYFIAIQKGIVPKIDFEKFNKEIPLELKFQAREILYEDFSHLDEFIKKNPLKFSKEDLEIADNFRHAKVGEFWVYKFLKKYNVLMDDDFVYGVFALNDPLQNVVQSNTPPVLIRTALLPFKGKIIYDGMAQGYNMYFGGGIKSSLKDRYEMSKAQYGIITELPIPSKIKKKKLSKKAQLEVYMKTQKSLEENWYLIEDLLDENPKLENCYLQLLGKLESKKHKKILKNLGIKGFYFAISSNTIVTSAPSKDLLDEQLKTMLPEDKLDAIYTFKV